MLDFLYWLYMRAWLWTVKRRGQRMVAMVEYQQAMEDHYEP